MYIFVLFSFAMLQIVQVDANAKLPSSRFCLSTRSRKAVVAWRTVKV